MTVNFAFLDPWHLFLPREGGHILSLMGSGGKTSLQQALAALYTAEELPTVLTCTTRCEPLPGVPVLDLNEFNPSAQLPISFYLRDGLTDDGKWRGLAPERVDELGGELPDRIALVEVDGAAKLPLKLHRPGEPLWPQRTSLAMIVVGAGAVGGFVADRVHRLGRVPFPALDALPAGAILEWDHLLAVLLEPGGYLGQVPPHVPAMLAVAGMSQVDDSIGLFDFVGRAMAHPRLPLTLFCETSGEEPSFRTGCRREDQETDELE